MLKELALSIGGTPYPLPGPIKNLDNGAGFLGQNFIKVAINLVFVGATIFALVFLVLGGMKWITSQGDPKQLASARETILYAGIGLILIFMSFIIVNLLGTFFNVPLLGNILFF